jgi:adenylate cyclase
VLPFTNKSGVPDQDYFSEGISADVITDLCKISALAVIDSNTSFALKGQPLDLKQLGRDFAATHVLDGAVRRSGTRLRISAQLIEIASGRSLWAERYDRELSDVFEIQDEISHAIVAALQLTLLPKEKQALDQRGTSNAEAYDTYLRARALWSSGTIGDYRSNEEIVRMCTEATALDPSYASAWALRALASAELRFWQGLAVDALASAERAIELDDRLPEPHCVRARKLEELGRVAEAEAAAHDAINLDQQSWEANREIAQLMFRRGQVRDALVYFEQAVALMRTDHDSASMLVSCYASVGDDSGSRNAALAAVARSEHRIICDPLNGSAFASGACGLAALGNHERAQKWIRKALAVDPGNLSMRYSLAATIAVHFHDEAQALDILGPFAECIRFLPHLRLLELDPRWAWMRERAPFQAIMERARKRLGSMSSSELMC